MEKREPHPPPFFFLYKVFEINTQNETNQHHAERRTEKGKPSLTAFFSRVHDLNLIMMTHQTRKSMDSLQSNCPELTTLTWL